MAAAEMEEHYRRVLGPVYAWSVAGGGDPYDAGERWLRERDLLGPGKVIDLGAGFGRHAVPLARCGAQVTAVDTDRGLLVDLQKVDPGIAFVHGDLVGALRDARDLDLALCLGDTLPHLADLDDVDRMLSACAGALRPGGMLVLQWRDTTGALPLGVQRFLPVAADADRSMHCFIEAEGEERIRVTDLVTELTDEGPRTRIGSYPKLRLSPEQIVSRALRQGLVERRRADDAGFSELYLEPSSPPPGGLATRSSS